MGRGRRARSESNGRDQKDLRMKYKNDDPFAKKKKDKKEKKDKDEKEVKTDKKEKKEKKAKDDDKDVKGREGPRKEKGSDLSVEGWDEVRASLGLKPLKK